LAGGLPPAVLAEPLAGHVPGSCFVSAHVATRTVDDTLCCIPTKEQCQHVEPSGRALLPRTSTRRPPVRDWLCRRFRIRRKAAARDRSSDTPPSREAKRRPSRRRPVITRARNFSVT
jgi:hypothetical protein